MRLIITLSASLLLMPATSLCADSGREVEFNRDVRPILADHCFACHGPDARQRKADLRLDTPEAGDPMRENGPVVAAGHPEKSELWRRINSTDPDEQMPPDGKGRRLNESELATLRQWIIQGAKFEKHWSLLPVRWPALPMPKWPDAVKSPLDAFVLERLEREGLRPSPEADRTTLLRRVTFGLTGLPPSPDEIAAFTNDPAPDAYDRLVDRLLASPRYGERMAVPWLDAARYADTSGYQSDGERHMWRWRDWLIEALNANMPFDQFTIEQLAGDLLPNPTLDQRIATGFNRNHRGNSEGGIIPEEYAVEYVADRVETTATVWLGLTLGCCRCHDHKYDPFTQRDFYSLFAFFNNVPEKGRAIKIGNSPPYIQAPTRSEREQKHRLQQQVAAAAVKASDNRELWESRFNSWLQIAKSERLGDWYPDEKLELWRSFDETTKDGANTIAAEVASDYQTCLGRLGNGAHFDGHTSLSVAKAGNFGFFSKFTLAAWVKGEAGGGTIISRMTDEPEGDGYQLAIVGDKLQLNLVKRWLDDALRMETIDPLTAGNWHHIAVTYDGSRVANGVMLYVDGKPQKLNVLLDELNQSFATKEPLRIGGGGGPEARFRGAIDEVRVYSRVLEPEEVALVATPQSLDEIIATVREKWTSGQRSKFHEYYLWHHAPTDEQSAHRELRAAKKALVSFEEKLPTVMVMEEMAPPRQSHILLRGQYDKPGDCTAPATPVELLPMPGGAPPNRLGLAQWLVDRANPLTSRVFVNRIWQLHFGTGIVKTSEDFGLQGEWPTHPELLDWLASEFASDWDAKRLQRTIVTSATFRQSAAASNSADPENRLLLRGPRLRLSAEMVRDQALFASGLLVEQLGGPSVKPLQPAGLWSELTGGEDYQPGKGADLVRRSLYTFWKRTIPPPTLSAFDSPSREACIVRQSRTNTPLQALALLNEPTFVASAKGLAERVVREADSRSDQIELAMLYTIGRRPTSGEVTILNAALQRYEHRHSETESIALVCSTILNLDEAVTSQ